MFRNLGLITAVTAALLMSPRRSQAMAMVTDMVTTDMDTDTTDTDTTAMVTTAMVTTVMGITTTGTTIIGIIGTATAVGGAVAGMAMVSVRVGSGPPMATFGFAIEGEP